MVCINRVAVILSLLPSSFGDLLSADRLLERRIQDDLSEHVQSYTRAAQEVDGVKWVARRSSRQSGELERRESVESLSGGDHSSGHPSKLQIGVKELQIRQRPRNIGLARRGLGNGSIIDLGTTDGTYILPVIIGSPAVTYPLQLDIGSSDLLIASTLCGSNCPASKGDSVNPYYDTSKGSKTFQSVNSNGSAWQAGFADGRTASGFVAVENVSLGMSILNNQVIGLINSTNLTLSDQGISGILGLGFPRLSILAKALLPLIADSSSPSPSSSSSSSTTTSSTATESSSAKSSTYLPPLLENLAANGTVPYPVFGLALSPPPNSSTATSTTRSSTHASTSSGIFDERFGSLTLGGVSSSYVSNDTSSGRTVQDIEWHPVVPFGPIRDFFDSQSPSQNIDNSRSSSASSSSSSTASTSNSASSTAATQQRRRDVSGDNSNQLNGYPSSRLELDSEEYLYWAIELKGISVNGTVITPNSTYEDVTSAALLDVGFNGIAGPQQDVEKVFDRIQDARQISTGQWMVPCNTRMTLGFSFGGRYTQLQPSDWMYAAIKGSTFCLAWPIALPSAGDGVDWQLGTPFLRNVYSVFDYGINGVQDPQIGFLPLSSDQPSTIASSSSSSTSLRMSSVSSSASSISPYGPVPTSLAPLAATTTIATPLPNALLPDPSFGTPSYIFGPEPSIGILQSQGLANSSIYKIVDIPIIHSPAGTSGSVGPEVGSGRSVDDGSGKGAATVTISMDNTLLVMVPLISLFVFLVH